MNLTREELRRLALPLVAAAALLIAGVVLVWLSARSLAGAERQFALAELESRQNTDRLARIAEEEREVKEKLDVYKQLKRFSILGEERRLEWADAISRIRLQRELLDLTYRVDRQRVLKSVPGKPDSIDFLASTMHVQLALLHEEDLLRFLADLRDAGNAYYAPKSCSLVRTGQAVTGATMSARLRAQCNIDLITVIDRGAKQR
jgi:hypothetical protein